jgi:hypothetical protein
MNATNQALNQLSPTSGSSARVLSSLPRGIAGAGRHPADHMLYGPHGIRTRRRSLHFGLKERTPPMEARQEED